MSNRSKTEQVRATTLADRTAIFLATGFGSGYFPVGPGTAGTVVAIPIYLLLVYYLELALTNYILVVLLITVGSFFLAHRAGKHFGLVDAQQIVIDEIAGFLITMVAAPRSWIWIIVGFLLFRLFDILKPWPASYFDTNGTGGFDVVMDDVMAGIYAMIIIQLLSRLLS
ncbi:MAG: phosphatidylglycerophosphatase A [Blastocatellia bacterium]|nr:phosphatidylglycerophosphatase A [Blastocatellia bacterium]